LTAGRATREQPMGERSGMAVAVGIDVAKEFHWVALVHAETGKVLGSRKVDNDPPAIQELIDDIRGAEVEYGPATVAIDVLGGASPACCK
jgi:hypothetical protein